MKRAATLVAVLATLCFLAVGASPEPGRRLTAVLGAFGEEVTLLEQELAAPEVHTVRGLRFVTGRLGGRWVVVASSGIGKVNAAMTTALLLENYSPDEVIFTGIAGGIGPGLHPGDIVIGERTVQHDLGIVTEEGMERQAVPNPLTGDENPVFFPGDPLLLELATEAAADAQFQEMRTTEGLRAPHVRKGIIATGDVFVASPTKSAELRESLGADAVEMEGAAVAQVCWQFNVPCLVVRSISDKADEAAQETLEKFYRAAARNSAELVMKMLDHLAAEPAPAGEAAEPAQVP